MRDLEEPRLTLCLMPNPSPQEWTLYGDAIKSYAKQISDRAGGSCYPDGNLATCPVCCWTGQDVTVSVDGEECRPPRVQFLVDFCMKLVHARKCGSSDVDIPHPNQRHYVTQAAAGQALPEDVAAAAAELGTATGPAPTDHGCSDHAAAVEWSWERLGVSGLLPCLASCPAMPRPIPGVTPAMLCCSATSPLLGRFSAAMAC